MAKKLHSQLFVLWHHKVLEETAIGISHALELMSLEHELTHSEDRIVCDAGDLYIIVGVHHFTRGLPKNYIVVQVEQPGSHWFDKHLEQSLENAIGVIDFSPKLCQTWKSMGYNAFFVPMRIPLNLFVFDQSETEPGLITQDIDVLFYGGRCPRRVHFQKELARACPGKNVVFRFYDLFGDERENFIARAKIILNLHFWPQSALQSHRIEYLMARGKCVVSEYSADEELDNRYAGAVKFSRYETMANTISVLLRNPKEIELYGVRARKLSEINQFDLGYLRKALDQFCYARDGQSSRSLITI